MISFLITLFIITTFIMGIAFLTNFFNFNKTKPNMNKIKNRIFIILLICVPLILLCSILNIFSLLFSNNIFKIIINIVSSILCIICMISGVILSKIYKEKKKEKN